MGFFSRLHTDILEWQQQGRSIEETYIYFKDYVSMEDLEVIWAGESDTDPVEPAEEDFFRLTRGF